MMLGIPMPDTHREDPSLLIRCPSCGQRFHVGEELRGRTVECGACDHRFRINEDVIVRSRKFYPGEHKDPSLNRFQRVPLPLATTLRNEGVHYAPAPSPVQIEPIAPQRVIAGAVGVVGMVLMALLLIFGATRGGTLDGMVTGRRLLMAVFTSLLALVLLVYANPRKRGKALAVGMLLAAGLCIIPFFFTEGSVPLAANERVASGDAAETEVSGEASAPKPHSALRARIGTEPLEEEIARHEGEGAGRTALGLWAHNLAMPHRFLIRDYIDRVTGSVEPPHFYPRDGGDYLLVIPGVTITAHKLAELAKPLGEVIAVHDELSIVEVQVHNENFVAGPIEKLSDPENPAFYDLNKRELESIDVERIERAVGRLADAEPKIYRTDITRKLIELLGDGEIRFKEAICRALLVWSETPGPAGEAALAEAERMLNAKQRVPDDVMRLAVKERTPGAARVLDRMWAEEPTQWETLYGDLGSAAEETMLRRFPSTSGVLRHSAVRILGRVGGPRSLEALGQISAGTDSELEVLIDKAMNSIRSRMGS